MLLIVACGKWDDIEDVEFRSSDRQFAIPLINTSVDLEDIFNGRETEDTDLVIYPDSSMSLFYSGDVLMQTAGDIFPDIPGGLPIDVRNKRDTIPLPFQRLLLLQANLTGDSLAFLISSPLEEDVDVTIRVPSLTRNGEILEVSKRIEYKGEIPVEDFVIVSMDGLILELYENALIVEYDAVDLQGQEVDINGVSLLYNIMTYSYLEGFFTKNDVDIPGDRIEIEVYDSWINGQLYFEEPKVTVAVDNSFGFPVRANINYLRVIGRDGEKVDLESPINDQIDFDYPELSEIGTVKTNIIRYDETNSNIEEILNIQPVVLEYDIDAVANPDRDSTIIGFVTDTSFIRINVTVELPIQGWADRFTARDTVELELNELADVEEAEFKLILDNGMPVNVDIQATFVDSAYSVLDSLFTSGPLSIASAQVNARGEAVGSTETVTFETMDKTRLDRINGTRYAILDISFLTDGAPDKSVVIDAFDKVGIRMGAKVIVE
jgi:hypothetical protein